MEMPEFSSKTNIASLKAHWGSGENFVVANVAAARGSATAPSGAINLGRIVGEIAFCVHYFPIFVSLCGDVVKNGFCVSVARFAGAAADKNTPRQTDTHLSPTYAFRVFTKAIVPMVIFYRRSDRSCVHTPHAFASETRRWRSPGVSRSRHNGQPSVCLFLPLPPLHF